jgi:hypothetical protein
LRAGRLGRLPQLCRRAERTPRRISPSLTPDSGSRLTLARRLGAERDLFLWDERSKPFLNKCSQYIVNSHSGGRLAFYGLSHIFVNPLVALTGRPERGDAQ